LRIANVPVWSKASRAEFRRIMRRVTAVVSESGMPFRQRRYLKRPVVL
jgi:hypothetical protein